SAAGGRVAGSDLRRLIQLLVVRRLFNAQLAPKADRSLCQKRSAELSEVEVGQDGTRIFAEPGEIPVIVEGCSADPGGNARFSGEPGKATAVVSFPESPDTKA
ncbi:hypothetical protein, partial [Skermanella aerolata]|uniref:hypothetical protein n=1 Tax=Skermanella aerolata TaxID=393310 RepID=UPI001B3BD453